MNDQLPLKPNVFAHQKVKNHLSLKKHSNCNFRKCRGKKGVFECWAVKPSRHRKLRPGGSLAPCNCLPTYRVTHHVDPNHPLTLKQKLCFSTLSSY